MVHGAWVSTLFPSPSSVPTFFIPIHPCLLLSVIHTKPNLKSQPTFPQICPFPPSDIPPRLLFFTPLPQHSDLQEPTLPPQPGQPSLHATAFTSERTGTDFNITPSPSPAVLVLWTDTYGYQRAVGPILKHPTTCLFKFMHWV